MHMINRINIKTTLGHDCVKFWFLKIIDIQYCFVQQTLEMNLDREATLFGSQTAGSSKRELWLRNKLNEAKKLLPMQSEIKGNIIP